MDFFSAKDQTQIFYRDLGHGTPVVLIHGWPLNADMFEYQVLALVRRGFRVITYDRRGFGRSEQRAGPYDYNTFADDLDSLIEHLKLEKVSLVGFSMGGGEIARYLNRCGSDRVASAVLIGAVVPSMLKDASNPDGVDEAVFAQMISQLEEDRPHFLANFTKQFFGVNVLKHPVTHETETWCFNMAMDASLKASIDCVTAFAYTDFRPDMDAFNNVPTLIIHGSDDKIVPVIASHATKKLIPAAEHKIYENAPHGLFITHKQRLAEDLLDFLEEHPGIESKRVTSKAQTQRPVETTVHQ